MKTQCLLFAICLFLLSTNDCQAQKGSPFRAGFHLQELSSDFGLGLHLDIPTPAYWPIIRIAGTINWTEIRGDNAIDQVTYQTLRVGVASKSFQILDNIRAYGEGGLMGIFPNDRLSPDNFKTGGYGLFGFEFFTKVYGDSSVYFELGATSAGNDMDLRPGVSSFGTGFLISAGFRLSLTDSGRL